MRFAKIMFTAAGVWGFLILTPLLFLLDYIGRTYPPPITHADFFYGFLAITFAWQIAFLIIGRDPVRFRPFMIPAMFEKFLYIGALCALYATGQIQAGQVAPAIPDAILGLGFIVAYAKTR
ncbi:MAG TPA: hypothetical protein VH583_18825 [Vicinamibacterales bacterium]|jgi:hypothetical protein